MTATSRKAEANKAGSASRSHVELQLLNRLVPVRDCGMREITGRQDDEGRIRLGALQDRLGARFVGKKAFHKIIEAAQRRCSGARHGVAQIISLHDRHDT